MRRPIRAASRFASWTALGSLSLAAALPADAQAPIPTGAQFQINTYTTLSQHLPSVAASAGGGFVAVWESSGSPGTDTSLSSVQGQRYASDGSAQGTQFQVNTYTTFTQDYTQVASAADGSFVVVWQSLGSLGTDTSQKSIQGQRYASNGTAQGAQFQVNTYTTGNQYRPAVAADSDGDFVVVWFDYDWPGTAPARLRAQRYASNGTAQGAEFQVGPSTPGDQTDPSVAADPEGDFVIVWSSSGAGGPDTSGFSIRGLRYALDGSPQGAEFQVNTETTGSQHTPDVATRSDGGFVVVWWSGISTSPTDYRIHGQRYASDGSSQGAQFRVDTYSTTNWPKLSVASDPDGEFAVAWGGRTSPGTDTNLSSVQARRYASHGAPQGVPFQVNTYTTSTQYRPAVAADSDGDFIVVWQSFGSSGTDTSQWSIQGQRYGVAVPVFALSPPGRLALGALLVLVGIGAALRRRV